MSLVLPSGTVQEELFERTTVFVNQVSLGEVVSYAQPFIHYLVSHAMVHFQPLHDVV